MTHHPILTLLAVVVALLLVDQVLRILERKFHRFEIGEPR